MIQRHIEGPLQEALADTPVVLLVGARQTGKSTLAQTLVPPSRYLTLDDATILASARAAPSEFVAGFDHLVVIDEVQRSPGLLSAIKASVDRRRSAGRFLLTGSANVMMMPQIADSLVGRMEHLTLWPLSQGEISKHKEGFLDAIWADRLPSGAGGMSLAQLVERVTRGGYPVAYSRTEARRRAWFRSYVTGVVQRDVRDLTRIEGLTALPRLLAVLAARAASVLNLADVSRDLGVPYTTAQRYVALLETVFLIRAVPAWSGNLGHRVTKTHKVVFVDPALAAALLHASAARLVKDGTLAGRLIENFIVMELVKQASWHSDEPQIYHFRTPKGAEVDVVLEVDGRVVGVEIKASDSVTDGDFRGLRALAQLAGRRFHRGLVLYRGERIVPFAPNLHAAPLSAVWAW